MSVCNVLPRVPRREITVSCLSLLLTERVRRLARPTTAYPALFFLFLCPCDPSVTPCNSRYRREKCPPTCKSDCRRRGAAQNIASSPLVSVVAFFVVAFFARMGGMPDGTTIEFGEFFNHYGLRSNSGIYLCCVRSTVVRYSSKCGLGFTKVEDHGCCTDYLPTFRSRHKTTRIRLDLSKHPPSSLSIIG